MKVKLITLVLLISFYTNAQFSIKGEIFNYIEKPVFIKFYENGSVRLLSKEITDKEGQFTYKFPYNYSGKLVFELVNGSFDLVVENENLQFSLDYLDREHRIDYKGGVNQKVNEYFAVKDKKSLSSNTLTQLLDFYRPEDKFYTDLLDEISRTDGLEVPVFTNPSVSYYVKTKDLFAQYSDNKNTAQVAEWAKGHLVKDNYYLENFGLLPEFISLYVSNSFGAAKSRQEAGENISKAIDNLLIEVGTDTSRGQAILTYVIPMLDSNGFKNLSDKFLNQAESLSCEITDGLSNLIKGKNNVKVGSEVPNIKFGNKIKGAKSLYNVKADKKLIIFWASWCPHCMNEIPHIKEFYKKFQAQGGEIVAISLDVEQAALKNVIDKTSWINYSDFLKWDSPIVKAFGVTSTPTMILLDKDNKILKTGSRVSEFID